MKYFVFILAFFFGTTAWSQSALNKKISVSFTQLKTEAALHIIERAASIKFGYNAEIFPADSLITGVFDNVELQIVLDKLLGKNYAYREKGNYIIIKSTKEIQAKNEKYIYTISGYIRDSETGETIAFASIYDSATLNATLSNEAGFYTLNVEQKPGEISQIGISKSAYKDTFILVKPADTKVLTVELDKIKDSMPVAVLDSGKRNLDKNIFVNSLTNAKQRLQSLNLSKKFTKGWQVSFVPYLGTNGVLSGKVTNSASFNIIGGYAGGLNGVEFGGVFNIDRDSSRGAQFAGVYNLTAGPFHGAQFAGVLNNHFSAFKGGQFAGVANTCSGNFSGLQAAGVVNFARRELNGIQAAGVVNYAQRVNGAQISGVINTANRVDGVQIAGVVNTARKVNGTQIGFINIADSVNGAQIGFLSFCRTGIHQVEYSYTDVLQHNVTLRTGSKRFYNIITAGYHPYSNEAFALGYGIGSKIKLKKSSSLNFELSATSFYLGLWDDINSLYKLSVHHELVLFKSISVVAGPDFNFYYSNGLGSPLPGYKDPISYIKPLRDVSFSNGRSGNFWVGFHVGIGLN